MNPPAVPSVEETYELLSHSRARFVLQYFDQHPNPVKLEEMAPLIARWEQNNGTQPSEGAIEEVSESLQKEYLPWMAETGLVTYDSGGEMLRYDAESITIAIENAEDVLAFVWSPEPEGSGRFAPADE